MLIKNPIVKNILSAFVITVVGYVLLNLAFMFFAAVAWVITFFVPGGAEAAQSWIGPVDFGVSAILIALFTWLVFRSKLPALVKATYLTVPIAVALVFIGISSYRWPAISYSVGALFSLGILYYFYRAKQPWLYFFSVILVSVVLLLMGVLSVEI